MKNIEDAKALYTYALETPLVVHNCTLKVGYSIHQHLQSNPHDYTPSHIILITICGSAKAPISLFEMAKVVIVLFFDCRCVIKSMMWLRF